MKKVLLLLNGWKLECNRNEWVSLKGYKTKQKSIKQKKNKTKPRRQSVFEVSLHSWEMLRTKKKHFKENSQF